MNTALLDRYVDADSPIHRLDGRVKVLAVLICIMAWVTTPAGRWLPLGAALLLLAAVTAASGIKPGHLLARSLPAAGLVALVAVPVPFRPGGDVLLRLAPALAVGRFGLELYASIVAKAFLSVTATLLLSSTTPFPVMLEAMGWLRVPHTLVLMVGFAYRYLFVIVEEALRLKRARDARLYGGRWVWQAGVIGRMIGTLFLRSYERAERVYQAMISRGYDPERKPRSAAAPSAGALAALAGVTALVLASRLLPRLAGIH